MASKIHIRKSHEGRFTAFARAHDMSVQGMAAKVHSNPGKYPKARLRQAVFAQNFGGSSGSR